MYSQTRTLIATKNGTEIFGPRQLGYTAIINKDELENNAELICAARNALPGLLDDLEACVEMLKELEWAQEMCDPEEEYECREVPACPSCFEIQRVGHAPDCALDALLKRGGGE
jgi:hypothetical protein